MCVLYALYVFMCTVCVVCMYGVHRTVFTCTVFYYKYCTVLHCTVLYYTVLYYIMLTVLSTLQCKQSSPYCVLVQHSTVQYSTVQYSAIQYSTVQYSVIQYIEYIDYNTVQCKISTLNPRFMRRYFVKRNKTNVKTVITKIFYCK